jgi:molybdenum cofactor cytidylyltransferase
MEEIGAVILAAGASSRFGRPKQLIEFRGTTLLRRVVDAAEQAGCSPVVVVLGSKREEIERELLNTRALIVENADWERGIGTSIRAGVARSLGQSSSLEAIVLLVCDQPFVEADTIKQLIALHEKTAKPIVASSYSQTLGVPAIFHRACFQELRNLDDASGAKSIIRSNRERVAEFAFPQGKIDIDTAKDYEQLTQSPQRTRRRAKKSL